MKQRPCPAEIRHKQARLAFESREVRHDHLYFLWRSGAVSDDYALRVLGIRAAEQQRAQRRKVRAMKESERLLRFFDVSTLPAYLRDIGRHFEMLAEYLVSAAPDGPEKVAGMRKLIESQDCFFRAVIEAKRLHEEGS